MANEIVANSFTVDEEFGSPPTGSISTKIQVASFTVDEEFGTPPTGGLSTKLLVNSFVVDEEFGTPPTGALTTKIRANSFVVDEEFGTPPTGDIYSVITANSFEENEAFDSPSGIMSTKVIASSFEEDAVFGNSGVSTKIKANSFVVDAAFDSPGAYLDIENIIQARSFTVDAVFGRALVYQGSTPPVVPPGIKRTILPPFDKGELGSSGKGKLYKDYSYHMKPHPVTGDITRVFDGRAVSGALKNIALTVTGERPFASGNVAGNIRGLLFELRTPETEDQIRDILTTAFSNYEPRAVIINISIGAEIDNEVEITVYWKLRGFEKVEEFNFFLERI